MSKSFSIFIFSLILIFEYDILFADIDQETQEQSCYRLFTEFQENKATVTDVHTYVEERITARINNYKDNNDYYSHLVIDQMLKDLIAVYQQKILEKISSNPNIKYLHNPTNNNPIIPPYYTNDFIERPEQILQNNVDYHLFRMRFTPEKEVIWDEEMSLLRYLELYFRQQFGTNEIKNYIPRSLVDILEDQFLNTPADDTTKSEFEYSKKEKTLLRSRPEFSATINAVFDVQNKYLEILLQHILTYYILNNDNYNLDPNLKKNMLDHAIYMDADGNLVRVKDFFLNVIDNAKFINENRSYYMELIQDPMMVDIKTFLDKIYPNLFLNKPNFSKKLYHQYVLEQDTMFLMKYIHHSENQSSTLRDIDTFLQTSEEKSIFKMFERFLDTIDNYDLFNLKQVFYIGTFPISLDRLVEALSNNSTIDFSNKDIIDMILGLYDTNVEILGIDYNIAVEKFGLKNKQGDVDNDKSLYFTNTNKKNISYIYELYKILYYLTNHDPDFCKKLGLKNENIVFSFKETLLEKIIQ